MRTGIIFGAWDLLHPGHLFTLKKAREQCDELILGFHVNPKKEPKDKNAPVESMFERWMRLKGCRYVDGMIPYETEEEIITILQLVEPKIRFLGTDYIDKQFTGDDFCALNNIEIRYIPRNHDYSTTNLRKRIANA